MTFPAFRVNQPYEEFAGKSWEIYPFNIQASYEVNCDNPDESTLEFFITDKSSIEQNLRNILSRKPRTPRKELPPRGASVGSVFAVYSELHAEGVGLDIGVEIIWKYVECKETEGHKHAAVQTAPGQEPRPCVRRQFAVRATARATILSTLWRFTVKKIHAGVGEKTWSALESVGPVGWSGEKGYQTQKESVGEAQQDWPDNTKCPCKPLPEGMKIDDTWHDTKTLKKEFFSGHR